MKNKSQLRKGFVVFFCSWSSQNGRENRWEVCCGCQPAACLFCCLGLFTESAGLIQIANVIKSSTVRQFFALLESVTIIFLERD